MRNSFPLFQSHLDLAHNYWRSLLRPGDSALDATCGNGRDTLVLACLLFLEASPHADSQAHASGTLHALDIQQQALDATHALLNNALSASAFAHLKFHLQCHGTLPKEILPSSLSLIVYNLGYLPGADKQVTTRTSTTLNSLKQALPLLKKGGCISLTAYPGHPEGQKEEEALFFFCSTLPPQEWSVCHHRFCNRRESPSLFLIQRQTENKNN